MLLDMDGTVTRPMLDFPRLKAEMGIGQQPILEALADMEPQRQAHAHAILLRHEDEAAAQSTLNDGCLRLLSLLKQQKVGTALITRNSRSSARTVLARHGLSFDLVITREDGPYKPDPRPLWRACEALGAEPGQTWMVGDGQYDVEAAAAAGIGSIWLSHGQPRAFAAVPWMTVQSLDELADMVQTSSEALDSVVRG
jgi:HAD superfamily hydrolase (TIGR01549 family)